MATHECPCGCGRQVMQRLLACKPGWYRLPKVIRVAVSTNYNRPGRGEAHRLAVQEAMKWYRENPAPARRV